MLRKIRGRPHTDGMARRSSHLDGGGGGEISERLAAEGSWPPSGGAEQRRAAAIGTAPAGKDGGRASECACGALAHGRGNSNGHGRAGADAAARRRSLHGRNWGCERCRLAAAAALHPGAARGAHALAHA
jgi:hypothetical protein